MSVERIALVGMAGRFPGAAGVDAYWANLLAGVDGLSRFTERELEEAGVPAALRRDPAYVPVRGVLEGVEDFDPAFFGLTPREAAQIDPQHRVFLECAWEALEAAGCVPEAHGGSVGVFAGCGINTYLLRHLGTRPPADPAEAFALGIASDKDFLATRAAYAFDLRGPAITVQTACSTSLVAVHLACQALLTYQCDVALAGGATIVLPQRAGYLHQPGMILSPTGRCRAFDAAADGAVFGNGVAVVALRRLSDALADGDPVHAVILSVAVNNDGAARAGYTAPGVAGQAEAVALAHALAGVPAATIGYVEAHGTGTELGDAVELAALAEAFRAGGAEGHTCAIGSAKSAVGHLDTAAGAAGLIKAALAVRDGVIPPSPYAGAPHPENGRGGVHFVVPAALAPWPAGGGPRRAGVSSFGIGGTNAHAVVEQPPAPPAARPRAAQEEPRPRLLALSARTPAALRARAAATAAWLRADEGGGLDDACRTAALRRRHHEHRLAVVGVDRAELAARLDAFAADGAGAGVAAAGPVSARPRRVAFVFPGQGSQWAGMARALLSDEPAFLHAAQACDRAIRAHAGWSVLDVLRGDDDERLGRIDGVQPVLFTVSVALAALWRARGVEPCAVVGHSMGEVAAACVAGALELDDAARVVCERSRLLARLAGRGGMLAVELPRAAAERRAAAFPGVEVAACNSGASTVLSGDPAALDALQAALEGDGVAAARVKVDVASHGAQVDPLRGELLHGLAGIRPRAGAVPLVSTVEGREDAGWMDAAYWWDNLRRPVLFSQAVRRLLDEGVEAFVEMSPHPLLGAAVDDIARGAGVDALALPSGRRGDDERGVLLESLGRLHVAGHPVNWRPHFPHPGPVAALPPYPWQRERCWVEPRADSSAGDPSAGTPSTAEPSASPADVPSPGGRAPWWRPGRRNGARPAPAAPPVEGVEARIAGAWCELLGVQRVSPADSFFALGGHSLLAVRLLAAVRQRTGAVVPMADFLLDPTLAGLARRVAGDAPTASHPALVPLQAHGALPPFFCAPPVMGTVFPYHRLARLLGDGRPFLALLPRGMDGASPPDRTLEAQAAYFAGAIRAARPAGPYHLGGWSYGATVAYEAARQLQAAGEEVALLALFDTPAPLPAQRPSVGRGMGFFVGQVVPALLPYGLEQVRLERAAAPPGAPLAARLGLGGMGPMLRVFNANLVALYGYTPGPFAGRVTLLRTARHPGGASADPAWGWGELAADVSVVPIPGAHMTLLREPHVAEVARAFRACLDALGETSAGSATPQTDGRVDEDRPAFAVPSSEAGRDGGRPAVAVPSSEAGRDGDRPAVTVPSSEERGDGGRKTVTVPSADGRADGEPAAPASPASPESFTSPASPASSADDEGLEDGAVRAVRPALEVAG